MAWNFSDYVLLKKLNHIHRLAANYAALQQSLMKPKDKEELAEDDE